MPLFVKRLGDSGPHVVFESGIAASHLNWMGIAPRVAEFARVLLYDRAGYGFSPPAPEPRTAWQCAEEIPIDEPSVIVGHSFGALIARLFAERHPEQVRALILLDPIVLGEWYPPTGQSEARRRYGIRVARWLAWAARARLVGPGIRVLSQRPGRVSPAAEQLIGELRRLPPETWPVIRKHWSRAQSFVTMRRYLESLAESCQDGARFASLGSIPLTVITGAHLQSHEIEEHRQWAECSSNSRHLISPGGRHWVHLDEPDFVVETIRQACLQT